MRYRNTLSMVLMGLAFSLLSLGVQAQTFDTTGNSISGNPESVQATFTVSAGKVHIVVTNSLVNPSGVIQNLSDLGFALNTGQTTGGSLTSSSGMERTVNDNGTLVVSPS